MNLKTMLALSLLLCSGSLQAQAPAQPQALPIKQDSAAHVLAQAAKLRDAEQFARAQALLEAKLKSTRSQQARTALRVGLADVHFQWAESFMYNEKSGLKGTEAALRHYHAAYAIDRVLRRRHAAKALYGIGYIYQYEKDRYYWAFAYYRQALSLYRRFSDREGEAELRGDFSLLREEFFNRATSLRESRRYNEAIPLYKVALEIDTAYETDWVRKQTKPEGMAVAFEMGIFSQAAEDLNGLGLTYAGLKRYDEVLRYHQMALSRQRKVRDKGGEGTTLSNLMSAWAALKNPRLAIFYGKQSVNIIQSSRRILRDFGNPDLWPESWKNNPDFKLDKPAWQAYQENFLKSYEATYRKLADLLISDGRLAEAQQVLGMLKQEELFQFVRRDAAQAPSESQATLNSLENEWEKRYQAITDRVTQIGAEYGKLAALDRRDAAQKKRMVELKRDLDVAEQAFERFFTLLQGEFKGRQQNSVQVSMLPETRGLQEALREIGGDVAILSTIVAPDDFHVILMTANSIQAFKSPKPVPATELRRKVLAFREAVENSRLDPRPAAQDLYKIVFCEDAVAKALEGANIKTLMWSLDDVLRYAPMSALHDGKKYLVEGYAQSVFTLASHSRLVKEPKQAWRALGVGVSKARPNFSPLPGVVAEMRAIIRPASEQSAEEGSGILPGVVALDEAFTLQALEDGLAEKPQMVHIASHFQFKPGDETDSFLLLGEGTLSLDKLRKLRFSGVDLLTLSACDTAMGGVKADGREVESFAELAQRQGAGAVMATLWPVADKSTPRLMQAFYREREQAGGLSKTEALRRAQLALLRGTIAPGTKASADAAAQRGSRSDERAADGSLDADSSATFTHPYFWAPFVLIGNWR
jgi:CHAT domain-containing protein